jgi:class 3 adenylate cyclase/tetratricopeptide (TPR) repeat protein
VTVIFSDVTGSTALGERLDPESVREVMARYFAVLRAALERHGGTVEKFIGDAVMAVFGIPQAREDDALRAVRAATEMRDDVGRLNDDLEREFGVTVSSRTGVNTGEVVTGDPGAGGTLVTGDTVNTAARLEQAARPGEILLGEPTYVLVSHAVTANIAEPLELKGKADRVPVYRLVAVTSDAPRRARRRGAPMLGRSAELAALEAAFDSSVRTSDCGLVTVVGEPGVGKSRLLDEFLIKLDTRAAVIRGRCLSYGQGITYWAIAEALRQGVGVTDVDTVQTATTRLIDILGSSGDADVVARHIAAILGLSDDAVSPEDADWAIRRVLASLASRGPVVLVLDDVHWAEPALLELIAHTTQRMEGVPLLVICMARPEPDSATLDWSQTPGASTIRLDRLRDEEADVLISILLGSTEVSAGVQNRIAAAAQGNPLFVEELLSMFIEGGLLRRERDRWLPTTDLASFSIPPTINALLAARLDQLSGEERTVLEPASVVGQVFDRGAIAELTAASARKVLALGLSRLLDRNLIRPETDGPAGEEAFRFRHILIRDAAYEAIPKAERAELHASFADWLESRAGTRLLEYEEIVGYHLEQAYRYRLELRPEKDADRRLAERAGEVLQSAGSRAFARGDMSAAAGLLSRSAALHAAHDPRRLALLPDIGTALTALGRYDEALAVLNEAVAAAQAKGDKHLDASARIARLDVERQVKMGGWVLQAEEEVRGIIEVLEAEGDERGLSQAYGVAARILGNSSWSESARYLLQAADHARLAGDRRQETLWLSYASTPSVYGPSTVPDSIARCREILELVRGGRSAEGNTLANLGVLSAMQGDFEQARSLVAQGCEMLADLGRMVDAVGMRGERMGHVEMLAGEPGAAERELRPAVAFFERSGDRFFLPSLEAELARALSAQGRIEEADKMSLMAQEHAIADDLQAQAQWRTARAVTLAHSGKTAESERLAREAVALLEDTDNVWLKGETLEDLMEVLERAGDLEAAAKARKAAIHMWEEKGNVVSAARLRAKLSAET